MELEQIIIIALAIFAILVVIFFTTSKSKNSGETNVVNRTNAVRKRVFTLPVLPVVEVGSPEESHVAILTRLGLNRENGCIVTVSIDLKQSNHLESAGKVLSVLNSVSNVFLLISASCDEEEELIYEKISKINIDFPVAKHRVLFHQSIIGKVAIVRQLKPQLHTDFDYDVCRQVAPHIRSVIHVADGSSGRPLESTTIKNWKTINRLEELLTIWIP